MLGYPRMHCGLLADCRLPVLAKLVNWVPNAAVRAVMGCVLTTPTHIPLRVTSLLDNPSGQPPPPSRPPGTPRQCDRLIELVRERSLDVGMAISGSTAFTLLSG